MMKSLTLLLLATTALVAESSPLIADDAPKKFDVLFINDFTLNFVNDEVKLAGKSTKCPGNSYPEAAEQFAYTSSVVDAIDAPIDLTLQYDFYNGGSGHHLNGYLFTKDTFTAGAGQIFRNFCFEEPQTSDLPTYVNTKLVHARDVDVLVLFTAASAAELAAALPINADDFTAVIVVGLNGADASSFYPSTFIAIDDFAHPEVVADMISNAYADIQQRTA